MKRQTKPAAKTAPDSVPTAADRERVRAFIDRRAAARKPPILKVTHKPPGQVELSSAQTDKTLHAIALLEAVGTTSLEFGDWILSQVMNATNEGGQRKPVSEKVLNGALAAIHGIAPQDETEAMLAAQMVATHHTAMILLRRLQSVETIQQQDSAGTLATKLLRTYAAQLDALKRYRSKGEQRVTVQHVQVSADQAVVGINTGGPGASKNSEDQPHAKQITDAPGAAMPGADEAHAQTVPSTRS